MDIIAKETYLITMKSQLNSSEPRCRYHNPICKSNHYCNYLIPCNICKEFRRRRPTSTSISPYCKYKCINCKTVGFYKEFIYIDFRYYESKNYYIMFVKTKDHAARPISLYHPLIYNNELTVYIPLIIKYKILTGSVSVSINLMLMLYRRVLYMYGNLPREIVMIILQYMIY